MAVSSPRSRRRRRVLAVAPLLTVLATVGAVLVPDAWRREASRSNTVVETAGEVATGVTSSAPPTAPTSTTRSARVPLQRVLLVGDGVVFDLAPALSSALERESGATTTDRAYWGFGLTRPEHYDWTTRWPEEARASAAQAVVVNVGANDVVTRTVDGRMLAPGDPAWAAWYGRLLDQSVALLARDGARVYWIGMLASGDAAIPAAVVDALNAALRALDERDDRVVYVDPIAALGIGFVASAPDAPTLRLRHPDGKHLCAEGAARLAPLVVDALRADFVVTAPATVAGVPASQAWRRDGRYAAGGPGCLG